MKNLFFAGIVSFGTLIIGNFSWQISNNHDWQRAFDVSFFELVAITAFAFSFVLLNKITPKGS